MQGISPKFQAYTTIQASKKPKQLIKNQEIKDAFETKKNEIDTLPRSMGIHYRNSFLLGERIEITWRQKPRLDYMLSRDRKEAISFVQVALREAKALVESSENTEAMVSTS